MGVRAAPELRIAATTEKSTEHVENKKSPHNSLKSHTMAKYSHMTPYHFPLPVNSNESKQDPSTSFSLFLTDGNFRKSEKKRGRVLLGFVRIDGKGNMIGRRVAVFYYSMMC